MKVSRPLFKALLLLVFTLFLASCTSAKLWANDFVVWDGYLYEISDEYVDDVREEIGAVTKHSDAESTYSGNFSNHYEVGTKYYSIPGIETVEAIAVEEDGQYRKAVQRGKYAGE